jgi:hypothetical protein
VTWIFGIWGGTSERQRRVLLRILERVVGRPIQTRRQRREHANRGRLQAQVARG